MCRQNVPVCQPDLRLVGPMKSEGSGWRFGSPVGGCWGKLIRLAFLPHKMLWDIETFPDRIVFTGLDGKTSTLMIADALAIFKEGDII